MASGEENGSKNRDGVVKMLASEGEGLREWDGPDE